MPKYYVQSGELQLITTASDARGAAIWAVHRALSHSLPYLSETEAAPAAPSPRLGPCVRVSEQGFAGSDGQSFETLYVVAEWNQLLLAIDRIERRLAAV